MKEPRFSLKNQVWLFDRNQKMNQSYKSPLPIGNKIFPFPIKK